MFMVKSLISIVKQNKEFPPRNLHALSMKWSCEVTWQIKYIISPPAEDP